MFRKIIVAIVAAFVVGALVAPAAGAAPLKQRYTALYKAVKKKQGKRAPGRNIRRHGIRFKWVSKSGKRRHWGERPPREREYAASIRHLRALLTPWAVATPPGQPPGGVLSTMHIPPQLHAIARCESGGNPRAISSSGTYRGLFQFDYGTWASVGGKGDPAAASRTEQYRRAAMLYARRGAQPWPVCGR